MRDDELCSGPASGPRRSRRRATTIAAAVVALAVAGWPALTGGWAGVSVGLPPLTAAAGASAPGPGRTPGPDRYPVRLPAAELQTVGRDIAPGVYVSEGNRHCMWAVLRKVRGGPVAVVFAEEFQDTGAVTIRSDDFAFLHVGCTRLRRVHDVPGNP